MARPVEFVRAEVVTSAMNVFWYSGYSATSINTLLQATNLKPGSLYGAFHSKRGLFLEIIDTYAADRLARIDSVIHSAASPLQAIATLLGRLKQELVEDRDGRGCLMINSLLELGSQDDEIRERINAYLNRVEQRYTATLQRAMDDGELHSHSCASELGQFLMNGIWGLRVLSKKRPQPAAYDSIIHQLLQALAAPATGLASGTATGQTGVLLS
ncbi:TetR/AcrR family transcriptional regulator [Marinobacterium rhizophilum]|uniref:TetR/AcrR family transcriptional regulator n=1 Tax=Marinobacterium rhizophilum TaxID=420402 RepID=A0ABY5HJE3_9GAMM|nr:TetR/AcrR family transcriptional regulator [Marinobacterium rhizophilum]UTW12492.1 TetR/AcrR family transcriptional regulator [Marinobacterium rhizophilum]